MPENHSPALGDSVVLEVQEGHVLRDPISKALLETGSVVTWSTHFARRKRDGAIVTSDYKPERKKATSSKAAAKES